MDVLSDSYFVVTQWVTHFPVWRDIDKKIVVFGETKSVASFLEEYLGYNHDHLAISAVVLLVFPLHFAFLFSYSIGQLNFQRR